MLRHDRRAHSVWPLFALTTVLSVGCPATVSMQGGDGFGAISDALWLVIEQDDVEQHALVFTTLSNYCKKLQDNYDARGEAAEAFEDAIENLENFDSDSEDYRRGWCEANREQGEAVAKASYSLMPGGGATAQGSPM